MNSAILPAILPQPSIPSGRDGKTEIKGGEDFSGILRGFDTENESISSVIDEEKGEKNRLIEILNNLLIGLAFDGGYSKQAIGLNIEDSAPDILNPSSVKLEDVLLKFIQFKGAFSANSLETQKQGTTIQDVDNFLINLFSKNKTPNLSIESGIQDHGDNTTTLKGIRDIIIRLIGVEDLGKHSGEELKGAQDLDIMSKFPDIKEGEVSLRASPPRTGISPTPLASEPPLNSTEPRTVFRVLEDRVLTRIADKVGIHFIKNSKGEVRINLDPPSLGSLRIHISVENQLVKANIITEAPIVKGIIETNLGQLKDALLQHGLEVDRFTVSVGDNQNRPDNRYERPSFAEMNSLSAAGELGGLEDDSRTLLSGMNIVDIFV